MKAILRSFLAPLWIALSLGSGVAQAQSANAPIGNRDGVEQRSSGWFTWGWTCDPDAWPQSLTVHFYVDGDYATGTFAGAATASVERTDVVNACGGTTFHGYDFAIPGQFLAPGTTHQIYAYALDNGGAGPNPLIGASPLSYTVPAAPPAAPGCSSAAPQASTTTATSGGFDVFAYGFHDATTVWFPTWADPNQGDLVWYSGTNLGNGTWKATVDLGRHFTGNPIYGTFTTHVYGANASYGATFCAATSFQRVQAVPPTCSAVAPQASTTSATSGAFAVYAYGVQNATDVLFPTWADPQQRDLIWYQGVNLGGGTWIASVDLARHFVGNPIYGTFTTHVYMFNASYTNVGCGGTTFQRVNNATYSITGRTGTPFATVTLGGLSTTADAAGAYAFSGLAPGTYAVSASTTEARCSIRPASQTVTIGPNADVKFTTQCERSWDPMIRNTNSHYRACDQNGTCSFYGSTFGAWAFSNANEVPISPWWPTQRAAAIPNSIVDAFFTKMFASKGDGTFKVLLGMNKDSDPSGPNDNNILVGVLDGTSLGTNAQVWLSQTYSTAFVEDNFDVNRCYINPSTCSYPSLGEELWIDLRAALTSHAISTDPPSYPNGTPMAGFPPVNGMSRLTVGVTAEWNGVPRFLEIVLWRDAAYDSCINGTTTWWGRTGQSPCDASELYDRRSSWGSGELVYFTAPALGQVYRANLQVPAFAEAPVPPPMGVGSVNTYSLPITPLFQWYYGGGRSDLGGATDWGSAIIHGVYLGIEMWGKGRTTVELDNYRLYAVRR